jgi:hypothetical protein
VSGLLGPSAAPGSDGAYDAALRDAVVFLSLALEPWRSPGADRTQVRAVRAAAPPTALRLRVSQVVVKG